MECKINQEVIFKHRGEACKGRVEKIYSDEHHPWICHIRFFHKDIKKEFVYRTCYKTDIIEVMSMESV